jgi:hypothetical protein
LFNLARNSQELSKKGGYNFPVKAREQPKSPYFLGFLDPLWVRRNEWDLGRILIFDEMR